MWGEYSSLPHSSVSPLPAQDPCMYPVFFPASAEDAHLSWVFLTLLWVLLLRGPWGVISTMVPLPHIKKVGLDCAPCITQASCRVIIREYVLVLWKDFPILPLYLLNQWKRPTSGTRNQNPQHLQAPVLHQVPVELLTQNKLFPMEF